MDVLLRVIPFFLLVFAGAIAAWTRRIDLVGVRALSGYVLWIAFPALLIRSLSLMPTPDANAVVALAAYCAGLVAPLGLIIAVGRLAGWDRATRAGAGACAIGGNVAFLAGPFAVSVFGPGSAGTVAAVVAVDSVILVGVTAAILRAASGEGGWKKTALLSLTHPLVVSGTIGAAMGVAGHVFTGPFDKALGLLANTASPVGLVALGAVVGLEIGNSDRKEGPPIFLALACKLLLAPILVWALTGLLGVEPLLRAIVTLCAGGPTAVNIFIQTRTLDVFARGGARAVVLTTLGTAVTLSALAALLLRSL